MHINLYGKLNIPHPPHSHSSFPCLSSNLLVLKVYLFIILGLYFKNNLCYHTGIAIYCKYGLTLSMYQAYVLNKVFEYEYEQMSDIF